MFEEATTQLRRIQLRCEQTPEFKETIAARDSVRQHYQSTFSLDRIPQLMAGDFREFLRFKNNKHWTNLHRQGGWICQDMDGLRRGLLALHNHSHPIEVRWDLARSAAKHLGPATLSAILHILYPRECGIWNGTSQASLQRLNIWPQVSKHASQGECYRRINDSLRELAKNLNVDLWDLDAIMWRLKQGEAIILREDVLPQFPDPSKKEVVHEIWQRNSAEVAWLKKKYSHRCQICGSVPFNGDLGNDICEAHHIVWLSRDGTDTRDNMILLCPNHHAAMHTNDPPPTFDREMLCFKFAEDNVITVQLDLHLRKAT